LKIVYYKKKKIKRANKYKFVGERE